MPKINIDGKEYDTDTLTDDAKSQIVSIQFVDQRLQQLRAELSTYQTARNAYAKALADLLNRDTN